MKSIPVVSVKKNQVAVQIVQVLLNEAEELRLCLRGRVKDEDFGGAEHSQFVQSANIGLAVRDLTENGLTRIQIDKSKPNGRGYTTRLAHSTDDLL
jgi:hypothetical protein